MFLYFFSIFLSLIIYPQNYIFFKSYRRWHFTQINYIIFLFDLYFLNHEISKGGEENLWCWWIKGKRTYIFAVYRINDKNSAFIFGNFSLYFFSFNCCWCKFQPIKHMINFIKPTKPKISYPIITFSIIIIQLKHIRIQFLHHHFKSITITCLFITLVEILYVISYLSFIFPTCVV